MTTLNQVQIFVSQMTLFGKVAHFLGMFGSGRVVVMDVAGDEVMKGILKTAPQAISMEISKANGSTELEIAENAARSGSKVTAMASTLVLMRFCSGRQSPNSLQVPLHF